MDKNPYMYLFIRDDLSHPQQIVQTAHAVDELNKRHPHKSGNYMVLCGAKSEFDLHQISEWLHERKIAHEMFYEPDISGYTAIATKPLIDDERKPMRRFTLKGR